MDGDSDIPQATQRLEHLEMFVLLGDPALRLPVLPVDIKLSTPDTATASKTITVKGNLPARLAGAKVRVTLERPINSEPVYTPRRVVVRSETTVEIGEDRIGRHDASNCFVLQSTEAAARGNRFEARLECPASLPWPTVMIRAYAATEKEDGLGILELKVPKSE